MSPWCCLLIETGRYRPPTLSRSKRSLDPWAALGGGLTRDYRRVEIISATLRDIPPWYRAETQTDPRGTAGWKINAMLSRSCALLMITRRLRPVRTASSFAARMSWYQLNASWLRGLSSRKHCCAKLAKSARSSASYSLTLWVSDGVIAVRHCRFDPAGNAPDPQPTPLIAGRGRGSRSGRVRGSGRRISAGVIRQTLRACALGVSGIGSTIETTPSRGPR